MASSYGMVRAPAGLGATLDHFPDSAEWNAVPSGGLRIRKTEGMAGLEDSDGRALVGSVLRAMQLFDCFEPGEPQLPLREFVKRSGYSKTTVLRLLRTLEHAGWLERTEDAEFRLTSRPFQVGSILIGDMQLRTVAQPVLRELASRHGHPTYLIAPGGARAICLERVDGGGVRLLYLDVGGSIPYYLGAGPRVLLAYREDELLPQLEAEGLTARTPATVTDLTVLKRELAEIREQGYSVSIEDVNEGVAAIGAPVRDRTGKVVGSLSVSGVAQVLMPECESVAEDLVEQCRLLSARLGFTGPAA